MGEKDYAVGQAGMPQVGQASKKPCYLVSLHDPSSKKKPTTYFIAIDRPHFEMQFIQVKGVFSDLSEDEISKRFNDEIANKDAIVDIMFPSHRIMSIKSLVFNANKPSTLIK